MKKLLSTLIVVLLLTPLFAQVEKDEVLITYYGWACFEIGFAGKRIVIDPFDPGFRKYTSPENAYSLPQGKIDYTFASHASWDHNYFEGVNTDRTFLASGDANEFTLTEEGHHTTKVKGKETIILNGKSFAFWTVPAFHDDKKSRVNGIICLDFNGLKIVHLGDLGHILEQEHINAIGKVDVLMVPIDGGWFTINADTAKKIVEQLNPRIVMPMHYKTDNQSKEYEYDDEKKFVKKFSNVKRHDKNFIVINKEDLKDAHHTLQIIVLKYHK